MGAFFYLEKDMPTNQLLPFGMGESPNRIPFDDWNALPARLTGFQSGIASSQQFNYILAQGGIAGYVMGQLIVEQLAQDATLENAETLFANFKSAVAKYIPSAIADKSIVTAKLDDLSVTTAKINAGAVTDAKLADNAVVTAKIKDGNVTTVKLQDGGVTNAKIDVNTITFDRFSSSAIATQEQALAGTANNVLMTPLRVAQAVAAQIPPAVPTGMIAFFDLTEVPDGWLVCDGSAVSRTTYASLFAKIGTRHGAGDGSTTFNLPDMDARFLEGTTDTGTVGTNVEPGLPNITGWFTLGRNSGHVSKVDGTLFYFGEADRSAAATADANDAQHAVFDPSRANATYGSSSVVQPASSRFLACIKS